MIGPEPWTVTVYRCTCHNLRWQQDPQRRSDPAWRPTSPKGLPLPGGNPAYPSPDALREAHTLTPIAVNDVEALMGAYLRLRTELDEANAKLDAGEWQYGIRWHGDTDVDLYETEAVARQALLGQDFFGDLVRCRIGDPEPAPDTPGAES